MLGFDTDEHGYPVVGTLGSKFGYPCPSVFIRVNRLTVAAIVAPDHASASTSPIATSLRAERSNPGLSVTDRILDCRAA